jgi:hypothetical protein
MDEEDKGKKGKKMTKFSWTAGRREVLVNQGMPPLLMHGVLRQ